MLFLVYYLMGLELSELLSKLDCLLFFQNSKQQGVGDDLIT